ncbi:MAG: CshA/CshB family fibrillar adhesin-related protein [Oscillospiraceae bacterium]
MNNVLYAQKDSKGKFASIIGFINFGDNFKLVAGAKPIKITNVISGGYTVSFNISLTNNSGNATDFYGKIPPTYTYSAFGNTGYTGINGNATLYSGETGNISSTETINISDITVTNSKKVKTTTFQFVMADAESTQESEMWNFTTDGTNWLQLDNLPPVQGLPITTPEISGTGTKTVIEKGTFALPSHSSGPVFITNSPNNIIAKTKIMPNSKGGIAFGIVITTMQQAVADLIESVALQQAGLAHILNAEGEKIQAMLAVKNVTSSDLLAVNKSVKNTTNSIAKLEMVMLSKLQAIGL